MEKIGCFRECINKSCRFRFPDTNFSQKSTPCPKCGAETALSDEVFENPFSSIEPTLKQSTIVFLDNIRSVYNVGSIIRTCDGLGITKIVLSGITPTPEHPKIQKTSLGATLGISWDYHASNIEAITNLKMMGYQLIAIEKNSKAIDLEKAETVIFTPPLCLIIGNENLGIDPAILKICDLQIGIPMAGFKESFNVSVAFGIAAFFIGYLVGNLKPK